MKLNNTQKKIVVMIIIFGLIVTVFATSFKIYKKFFAKEPTTAVVSATSTTEVPSIEEEITILFEEESIVTEVPRDKEEFTFNYETRSPEEIQRGEYLTVANVTTLPFTQPENK